MIYSGKHISVEKLNTHKYIITSHILHNILFKSISHVLDNNKLLSSFDYSDTLITITSTSVQTLSQLLSHHSHGVDYTTAQHMMNCLSKQQQFLENNGYGVIHYTLHDIIVINNSLFILMNDSLISRFINNSNNMKIVKPLKPNKFMSPETLSINALPAILDYRCAYYSLGVLITFILLKDDINYENKEDVLKKIISTPLYFSIKRSVVKDPADRYLLLL